MTKIPSIEERMAGFGTLVQLSPDPDGADGKIYYEEEVREMLTALLTELREWTEKNITDDNGDPDQILAHLDELINPTSV